MPTHRQRLIELLSQSFMTLGELSAEMGLPIKEVLSHLAHVQKSIHPPWRFILEPSSCLKCGFLFKERRRLAPPGRCPRCKGSHVQDPRYRIER